MHGILIIMTDKKSREEIAWDPWDDAI